MDMSATSSTPADVVVDGLLAGKSFAVGKIVVGPFGPKTMRLLTALWQARTNLSNQKGPAQAVAARNAFTSVNQPDDSTPPPSVDRASTPLRLHQDDLGPPAARWRLHHLRAHSIRGLGPSGETISFDFDGVPMLIYGPNGSGKSSLLGAIGWVLTGRAVTDCDTEDDGSHFSLYARAQGGERGPKITDWPIIHSLPSGANPVTEPPNCWAELSLCSEDGSRRLHIRRSLTQDVEASADGVTWKPCPDFAAHGISPLDIHLSVSAATVFGRKSLESSPDTRHLLSMLLGYDSLEDFGGLLTNLSSNVTKLLKAEREGVRTAGERLKHSLNLLRGMLRDGTELKARLAELSSGEAPTPAHLEEVAAAAAAAVSEAEATVASLVGLDGGDGTSTGLASSLTGACRTLEQPFFSVFPRLAAVAIADDPEGAAAALVSFEAAVKARIAERLAWWKKESLPGSNSSLLVQAAAHYEPGDPLCPLCDQDITAGGLPAQLSELKNAPADLRAGLKEFFRNLYDDLQQAVPPAVVRLSEQAPSRCLREDWSAIGRNLGPLLTKFHAEFEPLVLAIADELPPIDFTDDNLIPPDADAAFAAAASPLMLAIRNARRGIAVCRWAASHLHDVLTRLIAILAAPETEPPSLLAILARGKSSAADVGPLAAVRDGLKAAAAAATSLISDTTAVATLEEIQEQLTPLKEIGKWAGAELGRIFAAIHDKTIENCRKLYPHANPELTPSRLHMNKGRDRTVEAYLGTVAFDVPGQHIANAGMLRALALSFYFALLERHPGGLAFVVMDDPILSLDDDHREAWSANILSPIMGTTQMIVATHQRQFLTNCKQDFRAGRLVELNPRTRAKRISKRPGDRLERAEEMLATAFTSVPTELRKYREDLLITLDAYSPTSFFDQKNLSGSLAEYLDFQAPHPLASPNQEKIGVRLKGDKVLRVLDAGSHSRTEPNVTEPMVRECLAEMRHLDGIVLSEIERLEAERVRLLRARSLAMPAAAPATNPAADPPDRLDIGDQGAAWSGPIRLKIIGSAAAQTRGCVVDMAIAPTDSEFGEGSAVLVADSTLCPIARPGQWALLSGEAGNGDLVAAVDVYRNRYLRRAWSAGSSWLLEAVNPSAGVPPVRLRKCDVTLKRVSGICYGPRKEPRPGAGKYLSEWLPRSDFKPAYIGGNFGVTVEGLSLDPIAQDGQIVLVGPKHNLTAGPLTRGCLAVIETDDGHVGSVIKRVFVGADVWILTSPNPIEPRDPITISKKKIVAVWPVRGVLFKVTTIEGTE
ncbi:AAA family ATPase [Zavarzinella formosa]|uniref:AAA family ATPase n=1 Tax=Zavarzinella formosa TaxID=360055 RepID=UPI0012F8EE60|nr:AAA family ATPase [Zavarzinella formosa]